MIKKYEPIAVFEHDNVKYCIVIVNGFINFFKYIDNKLSEALSDKDIKLLLSVHKALTINKNNSIPVKNEYIDNKQFQIWYDTTNMLYFWYEIKNKSLCDVEDKYNTILNLKYNHTSMYAVKREMFDLESYEAEQEKIRKENEQAEKEAMLKEENQKDMPNGFDSFEVKIFDWEAYEKKQQEEEEIAQREAGKKIRRNIKIGTAVVCATIIGSLSFIKYSDTKLAENLRQTISEYQISMPAEEKEVTLEESIEQIKNQPYNYNNIQKAIDQNEFMTDDEKNLLTSLKFYFDENHEYIDTDLVESRLSTLKFEYKDESPDSSTMGEYSPTKNTIYLYNGTELGDTDIRVAIHEILHVLQSTHTMRFSQELSNEIATRELLRQMAERNLLQDTSIFENDYKYNSEYGIGYDPCLPVQYTLYELLSPEEIKHYQFYADERIIINALERIQSNGKAIEYNSFEEQSYRARAIELLNAIDNLFVLNENGRYDIQYSDEKFNQIYDILDTYYFQKNGYSMEKSITADIMNIDVHNIGRVPIPSEKLTILYYTFSALAGDEDNGDIAKYLELNFGKNVYVLPKTYFSNDHKYAKVMFDTPEPMIVEVNEEAQDVFTYKQNWVKEMIKRMQGSMSYSPDYTNFYYFERPTEPEKVEESTDKNSTEETEEESKKVHTTESKEKPLEEEHEH
ncbi:MAG: hypothetical protein J6J36_05835 [Clostridia bacterium]|nr:hypothetical protein [Clostridia bacterium]